MDWISPNEEFRLLDSIQACSANYKAWPGTLRLISASFRCRPYLLEFLDNGHHSGRYCEPRDAAELIELLGEISTEGGKSALTFLLSDAPLHYPYWKSVRADCDLHQDGNENGVLTKNEPAIGTLQGLLTPVIRAGGTTVLFGCFFERQPSGPPRRETVGPTFRRLAQSVTYALEVAYKLERAEETAETLSILVDRLDRACLLVHPDLTIAAESPAAASIFRNGSLLAQQGRSVASPNKRIERELLAASAELSHKLHKSRRSEDEEEASTGTRTLYERCGDGNLHRILLTGLVLPTQRGTDSHVAFLLIQINAQSADMNALSQLMREIYGLSEREADLACQLVSSRSLQDVITAFGITRNTAKTHMRRIFEKTNTKTQLELANLIHGFSRLF